MIVERDDPKERIELRGFVQANSLDTVNRTMKVLEVMITTTQGTIYKNAADEVINADAFWGQVTEGRLVDAREDLPNDVFPQPGRTSIAASELQLEME